MCVAFGKGRRLPVAVLVQVTAISPSATCTHTQEYLGEGNRAPPSLLQSREWQALADAVPRGLFSSPDVTSDFLGGSFLKEPLPCLGLLGVDPLLDLSSCQLM